MRRKDLSSSIDFSRDRKGFIFFGPFRELLLISLIAGVVVLILGETFFASQSHLSSKNSDATARPTGPVLNVFFNRDCGRLVVHSWPDNLTEINFETNHVFRKTIPHKLVSVASSEHNSTTILLTRSMEELPLRSQVHILRNEELLISEEFSYEKCPTGDVRVSANGDLAVLVAQNGLIITWDLSTSNQIRHEIQLNCQLKHNRLCPDGTCLFNSPGGNEFKIYDVRNGELRFGSTIDGNCSRAATWSGNSKFLAISDNEGGLYVFDVFSGQRIWNHRLNYMWASSLALSSDGGLLAVGGFDHSIRLWDLNRPTESPKVLEGVSGIPHDILFDRSDDALVVGSNDGSICKLSLAVQEPVQRIW